MPHRSWAHRCSTDPTPDGHRNPLNNAIVAAEAVVRESHTEYRCAAG